MFLKFHIHTIRIKASIFKMLTWNKEEIILLSEYYKVFHCPMFSWESKRGIAINLLENKGNKNPLHHMENKIFYSCFMQRKSSLVRDTLAVYIWLEEISSAIQKRWYLTKNASILQAFKMLNYFFLSAYRIFHPLYFSFIYIQKLKIIVSVLMQKILS